MIDHHRDTEDTENMICFQNREIPILETHSALRAASL